MDSLIALAVVKIGFLLNVGVYIWATIEGRWLTGGFIVAISIIALVVSAQAIGGYRPLEYGLLLGLSLFFAG